MNATAYFQDTVQRKFIRLNACIIIKTAEQCLLRDKDRFSQNIDSLCGAKCATIEQSIILEAEHFKMVVVRGGDVVFHYEDGIDAYPTVRSRTTGHPFIYKKNCFTTLCWLPREDSPISQLKRDVWYHIAGYLSIEEKRNMRQINKNISSIFSQDSFWKNEVLQIEQLIAPLNLDIDIDTNTISMKQRVFRYMLYVSTPEQFIHAFEGQMGEIFAFTCGMHYYRVNSDSDRKKKRQKKMLVVETTNKSKDYRSEARVAMGFRYHRDDTITPWIWLSPRGKLRYMSEYKTTPKTWEKIMLKIEHHRLKLIKYAAV